MPASGTCFAGLPARPEGPAPPSPAAVFRGARRVCSVPAEERLYRAPMTDAELSARMRENIVAFKRLQGASTAMHHLHLPGVDAFVLAPRPDSLHQQVVLYEHPEALASALAPVEAFFRGHGIPAWRISVPQADAEGARLVAGAGYTRTDEVPVMGFRLEEDGPVTPPALPLERPSTLADILALNEESFEESMAHLSGWAARPGPTVHALQVREAGRVLAGGLCIDAGDTTGIYLVATASAARRRGLASEVMRGLMREARARGLAAVVLQATPQGHGVYRRLGLRDVARWTSWVRRPA